MSESNESKTKFTTITIDTDYISERYMNPEFSDVTLVVEGKEFPVVRHFLAMHSSFFNVLFQGKFEDGKTDKLELKDVKLRPFEILLRYSYFGNLDLESTEQEVLLELAELAHFFGMTFALKQVEDRLIKIPIVETNAVDLLNVAAILSLEELVKSLLEYIFTHIHYFINANIFVTFNEAAIFKLLDSEKWSIKESEIIRHVVTWLDVNPTSKQKELFQKIRLPLVENVELITYVRSKQLLTDDEIFDVLLEKAYLPDNTYRKNCVKYIKTVSFPGFQGEFHQYETNFSRITSLYIKVEMDNSLELYFLVKNESEHSLSYEKDGYWWGGSTDLDSKSIYINNSSANPINANKIIVNFTKKTPKCRTR